MYFDYIVVNRDVFGGIINFVYVFDWDSKYVGV